LALACLVGSTAGVAQNAYITNIDSARVSVIDTASNTWIATIPVGSGPFGVAVTPDGSTVYVSNLNLYGTTLNGGASSYGVVLAADL
jgi:YVTN family beta-propeller protein